MILAAASSSVPPGYGPILFIILVAIAMAIVIVLLSHVPMKWRRHGRIKDSTYEAGMEPIGDARGRFNVRFYLVAMLFLLFDVELIFMYPWALVFFKSAAPGETAGGGLRTFLFVEMAIFIAILLVGYIYAWRKGIFRYD